MTRECSKNIMPDSITGMVFALEGVRNAVVLLNGPMGCKFYHSTTSQFLSIRPVLFMNDEKSGQRVPVDYNYLNDYFFRQPRVPSTYLDGYDYVYGTADKVRQALQFIRSNLHVELAGVINSPGASLIGDNLKEIIAEELPDLPVVMIESPGFSEDFSSGYSRAALELLKQPGFLTRSEPADPRVTENANGPAVNLLGLSLWHRYAEGDREELKRILAEAGIHVNCCLCSDCTVSEIRRITDAQLNVVIYPEAGLAQAEYLKETFGMDFVVLPEIPVGFDAAEQLMRAIVDALNDAYGTAANRLAAFREDAEKARALAWYRINDINLMYGLPRGVRFAVTGDGSICLAYSRFFMEYLGMIPDAIEVNGISTPEADRALQALVRRFHAEGSLKKRAVDSQAELVFSDANTIAELMLKNRSFCGIEISLPGMGYTDIIPKTHLGVKGALFLIEQVLNGLMSRL